MSILNVIRAAIAPGTASHSVEADEPGAEASITEAPFGADQERVVMLDNQNAPGAATASANLNTAGAPAAGVPTAAIPVDAGAEHMQAILGAEGIKGDAGRMSAALDLAVKSPGMSAAAVIEFITAYVPAAKPAASLGYEHQRIAAAGLAAPDTGAQSIAPVSKLNPAAIYDLRRANLKGV